MTNPEFTIHDVTYEIENVTDSHWATREPTRIRARCSCGASWTHHASATEDHKLSIFKSHVAYAQRIATRVD